MFMIHVRSASASHLVQSRTDELNTSVTVTVIFQRYLFGNQCTCTCMIVASYRFVRSSGTNSNGISVAVCFSRQPHPSTPYKRSDSCTDATAMLLFAHKLCHTAYIQKAVHHCVSFHVFSDLLAEQNSYRSCYI